MKENVGRHHDSLKMLLQQTGRDHEAASNFQQEAERHSRPLPSDNRPEGVVPSDRRACSRGGMSRHYVSDFRICLRMPIHPGG